MGEQVRAELQVTPGLSKDKRIFLRRGHTFQVSRNFFPNKSLCHGSSALLVQPVNVSIFFAVLLLN